jgi:hypothetical protein
MTRRVKMTATSGQMVAALGVTLMTLNIWRKLPDDPLPCRKVPVGQRHRVYFNVWGVRRWIGENRPDLLPRLRELVKLINAAPLTTGSKR